MQCRMLWQYYLENQKISCDGLIYPQSSIFSFLEFITEAVKSFLTSFGPSYLSHQYQSLHYHPPLEIAARCLNESCG